MCRYDPVVFTIGKTTPEEKDRTKRSMEKQEAINNLVLCTRPSNSAPLKLSCNYFVYRVWRIC